MFGHDDTTAAASEARHIAVVASAMPGWTDGRTNNAIKEAKWPQNVLAKVVIGKF